MQVVVVGATGYVGSTVLRHCLADPRISRVHVLTRRPLGDAEAPAGSPASGKLSVIIKTDWMAYDDELLHALRHARACLWSVPTPTTSQARREEGDGDAEEGEEEEEEEEEEEAPRTPSRNKGEPLTADRCIGGRHTQTSRWPTPEEYLRVTVDYTVAAAAAFTRMMGLAGPPSAAPFRFVYCSGDAAELVYNRSLCIMGPTRRAKGCAERNIFDMADGSHGALESIAVRPCGIYPRAQTPWTWFLTTLVLPTCEVDELAASMVGLAKNGPGAAVAAGAGDSGRIITHRRIRSMGRELLDKQEAEQAEQAAGASAM
ncbi:hypothetical protein UVI_02029790 [Ustilaginoidea virens]|uniref:Uncharacterized protein n=1 Tax=Ustilaginoidea virens TaxID=1159556 RepID=A0A063C422_USTVR|nr:hypothetical protein UVI_02029790 [Ustilaginoidea virens]